LTIVPGRLNQFDICGGVVDLKFILHMTAEGFDVIFTHL
jgi:hypothetical protein